MARNKGNTANNARSAGAVNGQASKDRPASAQPPGSGEDRTGSPVDSAIRACDTLLEMQQQWFKTTCARAEDWSAQWKLMPPSTDSMEFLYQQFSVLNQEFEVASKQVLAVLQQMLDAQLQWVGQSARPQAEAPVQDQAPPAEDSALVTLGKVQDEWLKMGRSWINAMNAANLAQAGHPDSGVAA